MHPRRIAVLATLCATILVGAACSSSSKGSGSTATTAAAAPTTTAASAAPTTAAPTTTAAQTSAASAGSTTLVAQGISFNTTKLNFKAGQKVTVTIQNKDSVEHNFTFKAAKANKDVEAGETAKATFTVPAAGTYEFHCEYHPNQMKGTVTVTS
jgi:plastocyanin